MRHSLDPRPASKKCELVRVMSMVFEEFETVHATGTQTWKKQGRLLKMVHYGSYARGDCVDDTVGGYKSDFGIFIVASDERLADRARHKRDIT